jgi:hypothetical protein
VKRALNSYLAAIYKEKVSNCSSALWDAGGSAAESIKGVSAGAVSLQTSLYTDLRTERGVKFVVLQALVLTISAF